MENNTQPSQEALVQMSDQLLIFAEHCAFFCEAVSRIVADHPHITPEVRQGLEYQSRWIRNQALAQWQELDNIRKADSFKNSKTATGPGQ